MESIYTKLALYGSQNKCARTDNVFSPIFEFCNCTVSFDINIKGTLAQNNLIFLSGHIGYITQKIGCLKKKLLSKIGEKL